MCGAEIKLHEQRLHVKVTGHLRLGGCHGALETSEAAIYQ